MPFNIYRTIRYTPDGNSFQVHTYAQSKGEQNSAVALHCLSIGTQLKLDQRHNVKIILLTSFFKLKQ